MVSYEVQVEPASGKKYTCRTTTIPLIEELKPDLVLILGTDTVVAPSEGSENYEELLKAAEEKYRVFLEANYELARIAPGIDLQKNVQIAVIPFPGEFQLGPPSNSAKSGCARKSIPRTCAHFCFGKSPGQYTRRSERPAKPLHQVKRSR